MRLARPAFSDQLEDGATILTWLRTWEPRPRRPGSVAISSPPGTVVEVKHAIDETAFVQQFELQADIVGEGLFAASHHDGRDEQVPLVDQPGLYRLGGEVGTAHANVTSRSRLHLPDRFRVEVPLDPRPGGGYRLQRRGVHDLVGRLPYLGEVPHDGRLIGECLIGLPDGHHVVYPAPVEVGADRALEVVDEGVHLLVRRSPVEVAVLVRYVAVERRDLRVDQPSHGELS